MNSEKRDFGKCDECGGIGSLEVIVLPGRVRNARFCGSCFHVFRDRPELSGFIAFQYRKPPDKPVQPAESP